MFTDPKLNYLIHRLKGLGRYEIFPNLINSNLHSALFPTRHQENTFFSLLLFHFKEEDATE